MRRTSLNASCLAFPAAVVRPQLRARQTGSTPPEPLKSSTLEGLQFQAGESPLSIGGYVMAHLIHDLDRIGSTS